MERSEIYAAVDQVRDKQNILWRTGRSSESQYKFAAPHILVLEEQLKKLRADWYTVYTDTPLKDRFLGIAAIAVRALEEME